MLDLLGFLLYSLLLMILSFVLGFGVSIRVFRETYRYNIHDEVNLILDEIEL